jgi:hypothetical protein
MSENLYPIIAIATTIVIVVVIVIIYLSKRKTTKPVPSGDEDKCKPSCDKSGECKLVDGSYTCMCGTGPVCNGLADTCVNGTCKCGSTVCGKSADRCVGGKCMCGSGNVCSGTTDTCVNGKCMCGKNNKCTSLSNKCVDGVCMCGERTCLGTSTGCTDGKCMCGDSTNDSDVCGMCSNIQYTATNVIYDGYINKDGIMYVLEDNGVYEYTRNGNGTKIIDLVRGHQPFGLAIATDKSTICTLNNSIIDVYTLSSQNKWLSSQQITTDDLVSILISHDGNVLTTRTGSGITIYRLIDNKYVKSADITNVHTNGAFSLSGDGNVIFCTDTVVAYSTETKEWHIQGLISDVSMMLNASALNYDGSILYVITKDNKLGKYTGSPKTLDTYIDTNGDLYSVKTNDAGDRILIGYVLHISQYISYSVFAYMNSKDGKIYASMKEARNDTSPLPLSIMSADGKMFASPLPTNAISVYTDCERGILGIKMPDIITKNKKPLMWIALVLLVLIIIIIAMRCYKARQL